MDRLFSSAEKSLGVPLTRDAKDTLHAAFAGYVSRSPELIMRYANDPTLIDEFWNALSSSLIDPVRRNAAATVQTTTAQRSFPRDTPSGAVRATPAPKPADLDERVANAWASYQSHTKK